MPGSFRNFKKSGGGSIATLISGFGPSILGGGGVFNFAYKLKTSLSSGGSKEVKLRRGGRRG